MTMTLRQKIQRAQAMTADGDYFRAIDFLNDVYEAFASEHDPQERARVLAHRGEAKLALKILGEHYFEQGDPARGRTQDVVQGAMYDLEHALSLWPDYKWAVALLGDSYRVYAFVSNDRSYVESAVNRLKSALSFSLQGDDLPDEQQLTSATPLDAWILAHIGAAHVLSAMMDNSSNRAKLAVGFFMCALRFNPKSSWTYRMLAVAQILDGNISQEYASPNDDHHGPSAMECLGQAMVYDPSQFLYVNRAFSQACRAAAQDLTGEARTKALRQALDFGISVIVHDPEDYLAYYMVAISQSQLEPEASHAIVSQAIALLEHTKQRVGQLQTILEALQSPDILRLPGAVREVYDDPALDAEIKAMLRIDFAHLMTNLTAAP